MKSAQYFTRAVRQGRRSLTTVTRAANSSWKKALYKGIRLLGKPWLLAEEQNQEPLVIPWGFATKHTDLHLLTCIVNLSWICRLSIYRFLWKAIIFSLRINNLGSFPLDSNCLFFVRSVSFGEISLGHNTHGASLRGVCAKESTLPTVAPGNLLETIRFF